jgi:DHA2 family multidrug resistance protein
MPATPESASASAAAAPPIYLPAGIAAVLLGGLLSTLNGRLLSVGQPDLRGALSLSVDQAAWIPTAYNMAIMFIGVFSVYLGAILGARRVLLACSLLYGLASLLMPIAGGYGPLLVLQVVAGLSSGTFYPLTLSFILTSLPPRLMPVGLATYSITILFAANIASSLSAWYTGVLSWRWIFWNASWIAPIMFLCVYFGVPRTPLPERKAAGPSWRGLLYWSFGLALIYGAIDEGERVRWFDSPSYAALLFSGLFLVLMSIVRRKQDPNPLIALSFVRNRSTILLAVILFAFRFFLLSTALLIPQFLGSVRGLRNEQIGPVLSIVALLQFVIAWVTASALRAVNSRFIMAIGFAMVGVTAFFCSHLSSAWAPHTYIPVAVFLAIGESFAMLGLVASLILHILGSGAIAPSGKPKRPADVLTFSGFFHTVRIMGGQIGTVLMLHLVSERTKFHSAILAQQTDPSRLPVSHFLYGAAGALAPHASNPAQSLSWTGYFLGVTVRQQAATLAFADAFTVIVWSTIAILMLIAFIRLSIPSFKELL